MLKSDRTDQIRALDAATRWREHMALMDRLIVLLDIPGFDDSDEYDDLLDELDNYWWGSTEEEILRIEYANLRHSVCLDPSECWIGIDGWE